MKKYIITEMELKTFHMAAVLSAGENTEAQRMVDEIRRRPVDALYDTDDVCHFCGIKAYYTHQSRKLCCEHYDKVKVVENETKKPYFED